MEILEIIGVVFTIIATIGAGILFILKQHKKKVEKDNRFNALENNFTQFKEQVEKDNRFNVLENNFTQFKEKVEKVETSHDKINSEKDKLLAEIKVLDQKLENVENKVVTSSHDKINSEKDKLLAEIKVLDQKLENVENKVVTSSHDKINSEKDKLLAEIKVLDQKLENVENKVVTSSHDQINAEKEKLLDKIKVLEEKLNKVENEVKTSHDQINSKNDKLLSEIESIDQKLSSVEEKFDAFVEQNFLEILNKELDETKTEIANPIDKKIAKLNSKIEALIERKKIFPLNTGMQTTPTNSRYIDNDDGTVTDNKTGLIWLKNVNCFGKHSWKDAMKTVNNLKSGQCDLNDDSDAGDWRLPTKKEWENMVDPKSENPAISNADVFSGVRSNYYWSSSTVEMDTNKEADTTSAWRVNLYRGNVFNSNKTNAYYVWPVRDGK